MFFNQRFQSSHNVIYRFFKFSAKQQKQIFDTFDKFDTDVLQKNVFNVFCFDLDLDLVQFFRWLQRKIVIETSLKQKRKMVENFHFFYLFVCLFRSVYVNDVFYIANFWFCVFFFWFLWNNFFGFRCFSMTTRILSCILEPLSLSLHTYMALWMRISNFFAYFSLCANRIGILAF